MIYAKLFFFCSCFCLVNCLTPGDVTAVIVHGNYSSRNYFTINATTEYIIWYTTTASVNPSRVTSWTNGANLNFPIMVVVRQQKAVTSWQLPLPVDSDLGTITFFNSSRTLCHTYMDYLAKFNRSTIQQLSQRTDIYLQQHYSVSVSTSSTTSLEVAIETEEVTDFYIEEDKDYTIVISPSEPLYYYYKFFEPGEENFTDTVVLVVESADETCFYVSIQEPSCPVNELNDNIRYSGTFQTVNTRGGLTIGKFEFPNGFLIVFVAMGDNSQCSSKNTVIPSVLTEELVTFNQTSTVNFRIRRSITLADYIRASLIILASIFGFYIVFILVTYGFYWLKKSKKKQSISFENPNLYMQSQNTSITPLQQSAGDDDVETKLRCSTLYLCDLARRTPDFHYKKSLNYLWHVTSIAVFYSIPVVQLVITYQRIFNVSGNQDMCYYNFLCANPLFGLADFNHIYSNIAYVFLGIFYLFVVLHRDKTTKHVPNFGIPKHYGLHYAMGTALIIQGILSACYHICPNQSNFQFDTSFMYVMAVLCIIKIYQNRHPDINATAYTTFSVLGVAVLIATFGIINGSLGIWIFFMALYIIFCAYLSLNRYFLSYVKQGLRGIVKECKKRENDFFDIIKPRRRAYFIVCLLGIVTNTIMALMGIYCYLTGVDFGTFLLAILLGNGVMYCISYVCMKLLYRERLCAQAIFYGLLALTAWGFAAFCFTRTSTLWYIAPAESRQLNMKCIFLDFYDYHDLWHLLSAAALFFTFMFLLCLDDDLENTPHCEIRVF